MDLPSLLPHVNASLNATAMILLGYARVMIAQRQIDRHRRAMIAALAVSGLFLVTYITYHHIAPIFVFRGYGWIRPVYFVILITHIFLAGGSLPFILFTAYRALSGKYPAHAKMAKKVWPVWFYVSLSGVIVYFMISPYYQS